MYHIFFIHSSVDGHLGCFHVLAIVNSAAIGVHVSFWIRVFIFSRFMPRSGIAGSYGNSMFSFLRNCHSLLFSTVAAPFTFPATAPIFPHPHQHFLPPSLPPSFPPFLPSSFLFFLNSSHSNGCGVALVSISLLISDVLFSYAVDHLYIFFWEIFVQVLCPFPYFFWSILK